MNDIPAVTADDGLKAAPGYFVVMSILDWWDDLPAKLRQDIEGSGNEPGCIGRARRFLKTKDAVTALDRGDEPRTTLRLFREFVMRNATQWKLGANHHHPMWLRVVEALGDENDKQMTDEEYRSVIADHREVKL